MRWELSDRADPVAAKIADRHYNRQKIGTPQFAVSIPSRCPKQNSLFPRSWFSHDGACNLR